jgi:hypothetical protein
VYENATLGEIEAPSRLSVFALDHFGDRKYQLGIACNLEVITDGGDPRVRWHEGKILVDDSIDGITNRTKEGVGADSVKERTGRVALFHARATPADKLTTPQQWCWLPITPRIVAQQAGSALRHACEGVLTRFRIESIDPVPRRHSLAGVESTLRAFSPNLTAKWDTHAELDWFHGRSHRGSLNANRSATDKAIEDLRETKGAEGDRWGRRSEWRDGCSVCRLGDKDEAGKEP